MKSCTKCGKTKSLKCFSKVIKYKDGHNTQCKECRKYIDAENYKKTKKERVESNRRYNGQLKAKILKYLFTHPCVDCEETNPIQSNPIQSDCIGV